MAIPATPLNFYVQTGNMQNLASWNIVAGATSYTVQRSTDGVNFTTVANPTTTSYLDTAVLLGVQYWYQVASTNGSGTGNYTTPASVVPTTQGEMSLGAIRLAAQQRADRVNSNFVTLPEWNQYINQSLFELYDLLITVYEDYFKAPNAQFVSNGNNYIYPLPNGLLTFQNANLQPFVAPPFYKLLGIDLGLNNANNAWVTVNKYNEIDRNQFTYPNTASTIYGVFNLRYRLLGNNIEFIPTPSAGQPLRIQYIPRMPMLLQDTDITITGVSGWIEYVIVDAAIKALQKEESDVSVLMAQKQALLLRIQDSAMNRDAGQADTISDIRQNGYWGSGQGYNGSWGGYIFLIASLGTLLLHTIGGLIA